MKYSIHLCIENHRCNLRVVFEMRLFSTYTILWLKYFHNIIKLNEILGMTHKLCMIFGSRFCYGQSNINRLFIQDVTFLFISFSVYKRQTAGRGRVILGDYIWLWIQILTSIRLLRVKYIRGSRFKPIFLSHYNF